MLFGGGDPRGVYEQSLVAWYDGIDLDTLFALSMERRSQELMLTPWCLWGKSERSELGLCGNLGSGSLET